MGLFVDFSITCLFVLIVGISAKPKFHIKVISIKDCILPNNTLDQSHPVLVRHAMRRVNRNISLIDIELNVTRRVGPILSSARTYSQRPNSVKDLISKVDKAPCTAALAKQVNVLLNIKFDRECYVPPAIYGIRNLNLNSLGLIMTSMAIAPGIYIYELEHLHPKGTVDCTTVTCELMDLK